MTGNILEYGLVAFKEPRGETMDKFTIPEDNEATRAAFLMGLSFGGLVLMGASEQTMEDALLALFDTDAKGLDKALDALSKSLDTGSDIFAALREANS